MAGKSGTADAGNGNGAGDSSVGGMSGSNGTAGGAPAVAGAAGAPFPTPEAMPLISRNVPAFSSGDLNTAVPPSGSNDGNPATTWVPDKLPAWIAYDLSATPAAQREQVLVAWEGPRTPGYLNDPPMASAQIPTKYSIEINAGKGGGKPPSDGWTTVATVTGNTRNVRQHLVDLAGGNWVRMTVTESSDPATVSFDLDVHSAPRGASDSWLLMGDSITFISTAYYGSDLPALVQKADPARYPALAPAAIGGTNTVTALAAIDETMRDFPGRFVTLNYGTNDHANDYHMEELVQKVLAAGKIPVVPHMPWSDSAGIQTEGPMINATIDALYEKYPEILHGPDLWALFMTRTDLIPSGDVHPNSAGQEVLRQAWAEAMTK
jgi:hypothetical protein